MLNISPSILLWGIVIVALSLILSKEVKNYKSIDDTFRCPNCKKRIDNISINNTTCNSCNAKVKIKDIKWSHYLIFRENRISTKKKKYKYNFKSYIKYSKIEIAICIVGIIGVSLCLLADLFNII